MKTSRAHFWLDVLALVDASNADLKEAFIVDTWQVLADWKVADVEGVGEPYDPSGPLSGVTEKIPP